VPARCNECKQKSIIKAYRMLCDKCAIKKIEVKVKMMPEKEIFRSK